MSDRNSMPAEVIEEGQTNELTVIIDDQGRLLIFDAPELALEGLAELLGPPLGYGGHGPMGLCG